LPKPSTDSNLLDNAAIDAIYAAAAEPQRWPQALQVIADCFDDIGAILIYQRSDGSYGTVTSPQLETAQRDYEENNWWRQDIRFGSWLQRSYLIDVDVVTERMIAPPEVIDTHPFYTQFLASHGLRWFAGIGLSPAPDVAAALSIQRCADRPPYTDDELARAARLARHVENALRLGIRLIDMEIAQYSLSDTLARLGVGVLLVDGAGQVQFSNHVGEQLLAPFVSVSRNLLAARALPEWRDLRDRLSAAIDGSGGDGDAARPLLIKQREQEQFLAIYVLPAKAQAGRAGDQLLAGIRAIIVVTASHPETPSDPALVRDLLGLTLSEARLASLVGNGLPPRDAATRLGITEETARTTLKRVFSKIGVSRQSELAALLTRLVLR
jgi:DNA-binding CsgD family transcriptional regulator